MKVGPKLSLRPFLHRALQIFGLGHEQVKIFLNCQNKSKFC